MWWERLKPVGVSERQIIASKQIHWMEKTYSLTENKIRFRFKLVYLLRLHIYDLLRMKKA